MIPESSLAAYRGKKILVTGGAGFVGSNLVRALLEARAAKVTVVDNLLSAEKANLPDARELELLEGSCADARVLGKAPKDLDYVFHLATFHGNQNSIADPIADHDNNTLTTLMLYEHLKGNRGIAKIVYSSAGCTVAEKTYDDAEATTEDSPVSLFHDSPYQMSKIFGEFYSNYYFLRHQLPVVKARFQNVYGPGEILGAGVWRGTTATVWRNVTPTFVYRSLKGMPLKLENGGQATRDFIYVEDIVHGLLLCGSKGKPSDVFNLASGVETSILELAQTINRLTGTGAPVEVAPARTWDRSGKRFGSTEKAKKDLGFACATGLEEGLKNTIAWTRASMELIERCIHKHDAKMQAAAA